MAGVEALDSVLAYEGADRAFFLLDEVVTEARRKGAPVPYSATTPYLNTIPPDSPDRLSPHQLAMDHRIRSPVRWNALAIVLRANAESSELGRHIASFQSAATLYDVGFQHFFRAASDGHVGDLLSSPGIYARSFVDGRPTEEADSVPTQMERGTDHAVARVDRGGRVQGRRVPGVQGDQPRRVRGPDHR